MKLSRWMFVMLAMWTAAWAAPAPADTRGVACHGCTANQMRSAAAHASSGGTVYVFNQPGERVRKYFVYFDVDENARRYRVTKVAEEAQVEADLQAAWSDAARAWKEADDSLIVLPPEFPIRSAAAVVLGPTSAETAIERRLAETSWGGLRVRILSLLGTMVDHSIPYFSDLVTGVRITIQFPDGSTVEAVIRLETMIDSDGGLEPTFEIVEFDDPMLDEDTPVPDRPIQFVGLTFYDDGGSLYDWMDLARRTGITVTGPSGAALPNCPTKMSCSIANNEIRCVVSGSSSC
ncbi:MAG: hypothetical protein R3233_07030 [Xanthomonadales bacterium]|nr:hypothetical protein [Xanthomonadales bacterium]